eukprot:6180382-Pleurochrysis_carterae.AAC.3
MYQYRTSCERGCLVISFQLCEQRLARPRRSTSVWCCLWLCAGDDAERPRVLQAAAAGRLCAHAHRPRRLPHRQASAHAVPDETHGVPDEAHAAPAEAHAAPAEAHAAPAEALAAPAEARMCSTCHGTAPHPPPPLAKGRSVLPRYA